MTETMNLNPESLNETHLLQTQRMHSTLPDPVLRDLSKNHPEPVVREACKRLLEKRILKPLVTIYDTRSPSQLAREVSYETLETSLKAIDPEGGYGMMDYSSCEDAVFNIEEAMDLHSC